MNNHPFSKGWGTVRFNSPGDARTAMERLAGVTGSREPDFFFIKSVFAVKTKTMFAVRV